MIAIYQRRHNMLLCRLLLASALAVFVLLLTPAFARPVGGSEQTQGEMNMAAARDYHTADAKLNSAYKRLVKGLDPTPRARLIKAQKAWITFRDAEASFRASEFEGGTAEPAAYWGYLADLTEQRTRDLNRAYKELIAP